MTSSCFLYFDDDDDGPCNFDDGGDWDREPVQGQRNPFTGQCEFFGGGPFPCDNECGPCPGADLPQADQAAVSWAFCEDHCTNLDEATCLAEPACRGIYSESDLFLDCWGTDQTGPIQGGECNGLDAFECSRHDDCYAVHFFPCDADEAGLEAPTCDPAAFVRCGNESEKTGLCYGEVLCDGLPPDCPDGEMPTIAGGCWTGECVPVDQCEAQVDCTEIEEEFTCVARTDCEPQYRGIDCVCDDNGCTCADHEFDSCEDAVAP